MSTPSKVRAQLTALDRMASNITRDMGPALEAVKARASEHDGYASTASGADTGPGGTGGASSVERAVERRLGTGDTKDNPKRRDGPMTDLEDVSDYASSAALALDRINKILARYVAGLSDAERQALRCIGDGTAEGAVCHRWATRKGQCDACRMRTRRRSA